MYKNISVIFLLILTGDNSAQAKINIAIEICNSGAKCTILEQCNILYDRLQQGTSELFLPLIKKLQCGFEGEQPKICCPPDFPMPDALNKSMYLAAADIYQIKSINLLPNSTICGLDNRIYYRISGGQKTQLEEHPWMALLNYGPYSGSNFHCGGVLISSKYVMTAAHCVKRLSEDVKVFQVRLGEWDLLRTTDCLGNYCSPDTLDVAVDETIVHEDYIPGDVSFYNDIALLRLAEDVPFSDFVKPICLPIDKELRQNTFENLNAEVAGWGQNEYSSFSDQKLKAIIPVINLDNCKKSYKHLKKEIIEKQICAGGEKGIDVCKGDSGGPLMVQMEGKQNWMAVGVVSFGPSPCGVMGWPSVYTRVTSYIDWILSKIRR